MDGKANTIKKTFSRETSVSININSDPATVWKLLTDAGNMPKWNSTIVSIDGQIKQGETIKLTATLDPKRVFDLSVKESDTEKKLVWGSSQGTRIYSIKDNNDGTVNFEMNETLGGILFPLFSSFIPSFNESFEQFAADLKKEAERISAEK